jgi:hypothetical protein
MKARWGWLGTLGLFAALLLGGGCQTPPPVLKPDKQTEVFNPPPANMNTNYPKQAFNSDDPTKRLGLDNGPILPARGSIGAPANFGGPAK